MHSVLLSTNLSITLRSTAGRPVAATASSAFPGDSWGSSLSRLAASRLPLVGVADERWAFDLVALAVDEGFRASLLLAVGDDEAAVAAAVDSLGVFFPALFTTFAGVERALFFSAGDLTSSAERERPEDKNRKEFSSRVRTLRRSRRKC